MFLSGGNPGIYPVGIYPVGTAGITHTGMQHHGNHKTTRQHIMELLALLEQGGEHALHEGLAGRARHKARPTAPGIVAKGR